MELWYPDAKKVEPNLPTIGDYAQGYPRGAVVHFTAGSYGLSELDLARDYRQAYFLIAEDGTVHQGAPLNRWGQHAGASSWPGIEGKVSRHLVGIEVDCAGLLKPDGKGNFVTHWGATIPHEQVRVVANDKDNQKAGAYHIYNEAQEDALEKLILWLHTNNPDVFDLDLVLGHDEVSPGRKCDPGGALSFTMPAFRQYLRSRLKAAAAPGKPAA